MSQMLPETTTNSPTGDNLLDPSTGDHLLRPYACNNRTTEQTERETGKDGIVICDVFS